MTRRRQKQLEYLAQSQPKPQTVAEQKPQAPEITKELGQKFFSLQASKIRLCKRLRERQGEAVIVQLELVGGDHWEFVIRGSLPHYTVWEGTPCRYKQGVVDFGTSAHQVRD